MSDEKEDTMCTGVCMLDPDFEVCVGCFRTLEELEAWTHADTNERANIREAATLRKTNLMN